MRLDDVQQNWNQLGNSDPLWAILSHPDKRGQAWDADEFFATGRQEIDDLLEWVPVTRSAIQPPGSDSR